MVLPVPLVEQETQTRGVAVADPEVEVSVLVPVAHREGTPVVGEVESASGRKVGEASI